MFFKVELILFILFLNIYFPVHSKEEEIIDLRFASELPGVFNRLRIHVNADETQAYYHVTTNAPGVEDILMLEDYKKGLGATRMDSQGACLVKRLTKNLKSRIRFLRKQESLNPKPQNNLNLSFEAVANARNVLSEDLLDFCKGLLVFRLASAEDGSKTSYNHPTCQPLEGFYRSVLKNFESAGNIGTCNV